ncbi:hypothetical protein EYC87_15950 [Halieaceae bacterium IMCC8485]|uniref:Sulfotransferase family protein n=1 Tax=Candidatus Seongchinamella marina TaxID=2518990 RepID=A0ABT3SYK8_9GAMM|nr:sulfotransferase [Candidatus Seongchinamella marina]MCX2975083.1 hypothetical protein [Candidatus Seongchinamella marina]
MNWFRCKAHDIYNRWRKFRGHHFDYVLIITYGRSGSTLLMGLLNTDDSCVIRGENNNFMYHLYCARRSLDRAKSGYSDETCGKPTSPWWGVDDIDPASFQRDMEPIVRNVLLSGLGRRPRVLGFKEIRYFDLFLEGELGGYLGFLARTLPRCAFVFNVRNIDDVMQSKWWAELGESEAAETKVLLREFEEFAINFCKKYRDSARLVSYEAVVANGRELRNIFAFLGLKYEQGKVSQMIDVVCEQPIVNMDPHWRPQFYQTLQDGFQYDFIGRFENLDSDFLHVLSKIAPGVDQAVAREDRHATRADSGLADYFTSELSKKIMEKFSVDFEFFEYPVHV